MAHIPVGKNTVTVLLSVFLADKMAIPLRSVLISDEVDPLCVDLLKKNGIPVTCKYGMTKDELLKEIPVCFFSFS